MKRPTAITSPELQHERLSAFKRGELIGRPMIAVHHVPAGARMHFGQGFYRDRVFSNPEEQIRLQIEAQRSIWRGGETSPGHVTLSLGPDECAAFCGAEIAWSEEHPDTNWSVPCVDAWEAFLPLSVREQSLYWKRSRELYRLASQLVPTEWRVSMPDLHSNIDLLAALRDPMRLCVDLVDSPELMDRAFVETVEVVRTIHDALSADASRPCLPATLQSDFCCLLGPDMFNRWISPTLEAEAEIVGDSVFHWDGPDAVKHLESICSIKGIYAVSYVPGTGRGNHVDYVDLYKEVQSRGMGVVVSGTVDQIKWLHSQLDPAKTIFSASVDTPSDGISLLAWFERNT